MTGRTTAWIGAKEHSGVECSNCGKSYKACTDLVLGPRHRACCGACSYTDTHDERDVNSDVPSAVTDSDYGFEWGPLTVSRLATIRGSRVLGVEAGRNRVEVVVSPTGRSVRVYKNGKELR